MHLVPRFMPENRQANQAMVDLLRRIASRTTRRRLRSRSRIPNTSRNGSVADHCRTQALYHRWNGYR